MFINNTNNILSIRSSFIMGVRKFTRFFSNVINNPKNKRKIVDFCGGVAVIDTSHILHKKCRGMLANHIDMRRTDGKSTNELFVVFTFTLGLIRKGIMPFYVFDGKTPKEKNGTVKERKHARQIAMMNCENISDKTSNQYTKNKKKCFQISRESIEECKIMLDLMGIQYTDSPGEADPQCVAIATHYADKCAGIISDDSDLVVFGGGKILTNFDMRNGSTTEINSEDIILFLFEKANEIKTKFGKPLITIFTRKNFIDFAILMGTDYGDILSMCCKGEKINLNELFEVFTICDFDIPTTIKYLQKKNNLQPCDAPQKLCESIQKVYLESYAYDPRNIDIMMKKPKIPQLINFLCTKNEFDMSHVTKNIHDLVKNYETLCKMYNESSNFKSFRSYRHHHCSQYKKFVGQSTRKYIYKS